VSKSARQLSTLAAVVLVAAGALLLVLGIHAGSTVKDGLSEQQLVGMPDMTPSAIEEEARKAGLKVSKLPIPSCSIAEDAIDSGSRAHCYEQYLTVQTLIAAGGRYYEQIPRFATSNGRGADDIALADLIVNGKPVENPARTVWTKEVPLATALNSSYMASQIGMIALVSGAALILCGLVMAMLSLRSRTYGASP
jgi:hypothetical protein